MIALSAYTFAAFFPMASKAQTVVGNQEQALSMIQNKIDQLRAIGWGRLTYQEMYDAGIIDSSPTTSPYRFTTRDSLATILPTPTGTITVSDYTTTIRLVTVNVTWTGSARKQGNGNVSISIYIAKS